MKNRIILAQKLLIIGIIFLPISSICYGQELHPDENHSWVSSIRDDHPRLFFNKNSFNEIKERALNEEREIFDEIKNRVDLLIDQEIVFKNPLERDGAQNSDHMYGTRAAEAALVYLILEDEKYLDLSKRILTSVVDYYTFRNEHNLNIEWYAFSRINSLAAFDWIYNSLSENERIEIGTPLLKAIHFMPLKERGDVFRRNTGDYKSGFYGPTILPWYAGLVFHETGVNDSLSLSLLKQGYNDHIELLKYRSNISGEDGGAASSVPGYFMGAYPWAEFNFLHSFNSATGVDISKEWPYMPGFINYVFWNWLPGDLEYGYGDSRHYNNKLSLSLMHLHIAQLTHFYGESHPEIIALGKWMQTKVAREKQTQFPYARFLLTKSHEEILPKAPGDNFSKAKHFKNMGQIFMRSGSGDDDTYVLFTAGGLLGQHRHFDNNNFIIFKNGYLAMDTGTRPQPGLHLSHYYCRTVAHNCITIKMPDEKMPWYWGGAALNEEDLPIPNDGGQNNKLGSEVIAFEEKDQYVYIASDATKSYHEDKAEQIIRQFVFLPPNHFVIFDRVKSKKPEFQKKWLLHTATEPVVNQNEFYADHWGGRLYSRTIFPENATLLKVGGPGKQFWSDGRNWALPKLTPDDWNYSNMKWLDNNHDLFGQWRIEVSPINPNKEDYFLHLLQVGDASLKSMVNSESVKSEGMAGVRFSIDGKKYELMFNTKGEVGGKIAISKDGVYILKEYISPQINEQ